MSTATISSNPLLKGSGLPPFEEIKPEHVVPAVNELITELDTELTKLENNVAPTWSGLVEPLEKMPIYGKLVLRASNTVWHGKALPNRGNITRTLLPKITCCQKLHEWYCNIAPNPLELSRPGTS